MRRITIQIGEGIPDGLALDLVRGVVRSGYISNDNTEYCYLTTFRIPGTGVGRSRRGKYVVAARRTRAGNDAFTVERE